jgi:hypothetical protein
MRSLSLARLPAVPFLAMALLLALPAPEVLAQSKDVRVSGMGVRKCTEWLEWKTAQKGEARAMALEWATGFIAGHNVYSRGGPNQGSVVADTATLATLIDNYCEKRPDNRIFTGVIDITQSLGGAKINIAPKTPDKSQNPRPDSKAPRES